MHKQFIITAYTFAAGAILFLSISSKKYLISGTIFIIISGLIWGHFLFPNQYQDAMWAIGALLALDIDLIALGTGALIGYVIRRIVLWFKR